LGTIGNRVYP